MIHATKGQWLHTNCPKNDFRYDIPIIGVRESATRAVTTLCQYAGNGYFFCTLCDAEIPICNALLIAWHQIQRDYAGRKEVL
jgi:hypothetical protein